MTGKDFFYSLEKAERDAVVSILKKEQEDRRIKLQRMSPTIREELKETIEQYVGGWKNDF